ncbi:MAG: ATP-binding protein [Streptococcaceae bacterium]|jgi:DNA helicase HerA-like ATPase|nr:ATP-binding protein [Streptococcaceae bacterium]
MLEEIYELEREIGIVEQVSFQSVEFSSKSSDLNTVLNEGSLWKIRGVNDFVYIKVDYQTLLLLTITKVRNRGYDNEDEIGLQEKIQKNLSFSATIIGTLKGGEFISGTSIFPQVGATIYATSSSIIEKIFSTSGDHLITLGSINNFPESSPYLDLKEILTSHLAILGNTGSGKSTTMRVLVDSYHQVEKNLSGLFKLFIFDVHGDHSELEFAKIIKAKECHIPIEKITLEDWEAALLPSEKTQKMILGQAVSNVREVNEETTLERFEEELENAKAEYSGRDGIGKRADSQLGSLFSRFFDLKERYGCNGGILNAENGSILSLRNNEEYRDSKFFVINLEGLDDDALRLVTNYLVREVYDFNLKKFEGERRGRPFNYLYLDEAHRYVKPGATIFEKIAREGRKFNLYMGIISQIPSELSPIVMGMVGSYFIHRIQNSIDIDFIRKNVPSATNDLIMRLPNLPVGTALLSGSSFKIPFELSIDPRGYGKASESLSPIIKK